MTAKQKALLKTFGSVSAFAVFLTVYVFNPIAGAVIAGIGVLAFVTYSVYRLFLMNEEFKDRYKKQ